MPSKLTVSGTGPLVGFAVIRAVGTAEEIVASKDPVVQQFLERDLEMAVIQANEAPTTERRMGGH